MMKIDSKVVRLIFAVLCQLYIVTCMPPLASRVYRCSTADWWDSFNAKGYSTCDSKSQYITGLYRNSLGDDGIYRLEEVKCCGRTVPYYHQPTQCEAADWVDSLDK